MALHGWGRPVRFVTNWKKVKMIKSEFVENADFSEDSQMKQAALGYILEAWQEAVHDGLEPEMLANAALFAAFSDLVSTYGEEAVAGMTEGLSKRIHHGEFTLYRVTQ